MLRPYLPQGTKEMGTSHRHIAMHISRNSASSSDQSSNHHSHISLPLGNPRAASFLEGKQIPRHVGPEKKFEGKFIKFATSGISRKRLLRDYPENDYSKGLESQGEKMSFTIILYSRLLARHPGTARLKIREILIETSQTTPRDTCFNRPISIY